MPHEKNNGHLTSRIGRPVRYGLPLDVKKRGHKNLRYTGIVVDEVWANPAINKSKPHGNKCENGSGCWGDYSFCGQLIKWDNGDHDIRLAYYRRRCGEDHWEYASQMTVSSNWRTMKALLQATLRMKKWFVNQPNISA